MGAHAADEPFGCSCPIGGGGGHPQIPGGGAIAASATYAIDRAGLGSSWNDMSASGTDYKATATLGSFISQGRTTSASYLIHHPLSLNVVTDSSALTLEALEWEEPPEDP